MDAAARVAQPVVPAAVARGETALVVVRAASAGTNRAEPRAAKAAAVRPGLKAAHAKRTTVHRVVRTVLVPHVGTMAAVPVERVVAARRGIVLAGTVASPNLIRGDQDPRIRGAFP